VLCMDLSYGTNRKDYVMNLPLKIFYVIYVYLKCLIMHILFYYNLQFPI
jgi:hypothetical protein